MNNIQWATQWGFSFIIVTGIDVFSCFALLYFNLCETLVCAEYLLNANWKPWVWGKMYFQDTKCHRLWVNKHKLGMSSCMICSWRIIEFSSSSLGRICPPCPKTETMTVFQVLLQPPEHFCWALDHLSPHPPFPVYVNPPKSICSFQAMCWYVR